MNLVKSLLHLSKFSMDNVTRKLQSIAVLLIACLSGISCTSNSSSSRSSADTSTSAGNTYGSDRLQPIETQLENAKADQRIVLLVLISHIDSADHRALGLAEQVRQKIPGAIVAQMDRTDSLNRSRVDKWQLSSIPLPAIFIVSPKGMLVSGYTLDDASAEGLLSDVPSPKTDDAYVALTNGAPVFMLVSPTNFADRSKVIAACEAANNQLSKPATVIEVDQTDPAEASLVKNYKIDPSKGTATLLVINADGQVTDIYPDGRATATALAASTTKTVKTACCSTGGSCD